MSKVELDDSSLLCVDEDSTPVSKNVMALTGEMLVTIKMHAKMP